MSPPPWPALLDMDSNPAKVTEGPKLSEDTKIVDDGLFGMEDLGRRPASTTGARTRATRVGKPIRV